MRQMEEKMIRAIQRRKSRHLNNTSVLIDPEYGLNANVYLFGNRIATVTIYPTGAFDVYPDVETFWRWPTATTCSRLQALGVSCGYGIRNAYINSTPVHHPAPTPLSAFPTPERIDRHAQPTQTLAGA